MTTPITIQGKVSIQLVAKGSKSERKTHVITLDNGEFRILRLKGGNSMYDSRLDTLVSDRKVELIGIDRQPIFIIESINTLEQGDK